MPHGSTIPEIPYEGKWLHRGSRVWFQVQTWSVHRGDFLPKLGFPHGQLACPKAYQLAMNDGDEDEWDVMSRRQESTIEFSYSGQ